MSQARPPERVPCRPPRLRLTGLVDVGRGPAAGARLDRDPLGPQGKQLRRHCLCVEEDLDERVAVEEQLRGHGLEQRRRGQSGCRLRFSGGIDRRPGDALGHQLHRPLRHRVGQIGLAHPGLVAARPGIARHGTRPAAREERPGLDPGLPTEPLHLDSLRPLSRRATKRAGATSARPDSQFFSLLLLCHISVTLSTSFTY